jgi:RND family efflux transporter MFP subunit
MKLQHSALILISIFITSVIHTPESCQASEDTKEGTAPPKPALTITAEKPKLVHLSESLSANGDVSAWQEAIIGNETNGLRLNEVNVNVGDQVKRGQVLATFATETILADLGKIQANVEEAKAGLAEAAKNAERARNVKVTGAWSEQQIDRYLAEEQTAKARLDAQSALIKVQQLKLKQSKVLAPDDGVISSRTATIGAVLPSGQELFRLIRKNRLEWRAEVPSSELSQIKPGYKAAISTPNGSVIEGKVRMVAPTVNSQTRLGIVYVDIPSHKELKIGMFAKGTFELGNSNALTVPQQAIVIRDGFNYVFKVGDDNRVSQIKVKIGRRSNDRVEVLEGINAEQKLVSSGTGFLNDGDLVNVVTLQNLVPSLQTK